MPTTIDTTFLDTMPPNVAVQFFDRVTATPDAEAFRFPRGEAWESVTWKQAGDKVEALAAGLIALGVEPEQRVGIASGTRYEWILADLAVMCAAGATTTVYPTTNAEDTVYILGDSESRVVFAEDDEQLAKLAAHRAELPHVSKVVTFEGKADGDWVISLDDLAALGAQKLAEQPDVVRTTSAAIAPDQLATLIYTSGTTGRPKGVRLRHSSWVYEGEAIRAQGILSETDLEFRWLPMAHSFGKVLMSTQMACGFAAAIDGRVDKIVDNLGVVKPTFMGAAPRIFEKAHGRIVTMQAAEGGAKEKLFKAAFATRPRGRAPQARGQVRADRAEGQARPVRQAGLQQGPRPLRWARPLLHLRCRRAQPRHRRVVRRGRHHDPRGLRPDRDLGRVVRQPPRPQQVRHGRPGLPGQRGQARRQRRGHDQGPRRHGRLPQPPRGDRQTLDRRRLAAHRRQGRPRRGRPPGHHRPDQGALQDLRRQVHRPAGDRVEVQGRVPLRQPVHGVRRETATTASRSSPSTPTRWRAGPRPTA